MNEEKVLINFKFFVKHNTNTSILLATLEEHGVTKSKQAMAFVRAGKQTF